MLFQLVWNIRKVLEEFENRWIEEFPILLNRFICIQMFLNSPKLEVLKRLQIKSSTLELFYWSFHYFIAVITVFTADTQRNHLEFPYYFIRKWSFTDSPSITKLIQTLPHIEAVCKTSVPRDQLDGEEAFFQDHCIFFPHLLLLTQEASLPKRKITNFTTLWWISPWLADSAHLGALSHSLLNRKGGKSLGVDIDREVTVTITGKKGMTWIRLI